MSSTDPKCRRYRYCFVPHCKTTTFNTPYKRFISVPRVDGIRDKWFKVCNKVEGSRQCQFYCCEDHFDLENDIANMVQHNLTGCALKVKEGVVPSIFECQKNLQCLNTTKQPKYACIKDETDNKKKHVYCVVPNCTNSSAKHPSKVFIKLPEDLAMRRRWYAAMKRGNFKGAHIHFSSANHVCQDHFDLEKDVENFQQVFKQQKGKILLKKDAVPHKFECQQISKSSQRKERAWKRERKRIVADLLRAASIESKKSKVPEEKQISESSLMVPVEQNSNKITVKTEIIDTEENNVEPLQNIFIKEEPKSDSEISESEESELNYVLDMVMKENKEYEENSCSNSSETNQESDVPQFSLECLLEDNEQTILPDVPPVSGYEKNNSTECSSAHSTPYPKPKRFTDREGDHAFKIQVSCDGSSKNTLSIYSDILKKLFISKDIGFRIFVYAVDVPPGCVLRASPMFANPTSGFEIVTRCPSHAHEDKLKGLKHYYHVVQSVSAQASYEMDLASGQFSVVVPYEEPQKGELYTVYGYKLTCFNSCSNGINRRPFVILYTLEKNGVELGRYTVDVKVCACPARDMRMEVLRFQNNSSDSKSEGENSDETKIYSLTVDDVDLYKFLSQMKVLYESGDFVRCVTNTDKCR